MALPKFEEATAYGPPLGSGGLLRSLRDVWDVCLPWAERIVIDENRSGSTPDEFIERLEGAIDSESTAIACTFRGATREVRWSTTLRSLPTELLELGTNKVQQTTLFVSGHRSPEVCSELLLATASSVRAWFGGYTPEPTRVLLHLKLHGFTEETAWRVAGYRFEHLRTSQVVPALLGLNFERWTNPHVPFALDWSNYWDEKTAAELSFPNPLLDSEILQFSTRLPNGAWLVKLTQEPLDLSRDDHIAAVARAYIRFAPVRDALWSGNPG